eukprot:m.781308 g.781308  ORF g.781308 m.781308 type:complete len:81 (-) comp23285_c2_seq46:2234-2476(-)
MFNFRHHFQFIERKPKAPDNHAAPELPPQRLDLSRVSHRALLNIFTVCCNFVPHLVLRENEIIHLQPVSLELGNTFQRMF